MIDMRLQLGITDHVMLHIADLLPKLNAILGMTQCDRLSDEERAALMFLIASFFFHAAAHARHVSRGGAPELPVSSDLYRDLGRLLAEQHGLARDSSLRFLQ